MSNYLSLRCILVAEIYSITSSVSFLWYRNLYIIISHKCTPKTDYITKNTGENSHPRIIYSIEYLVVFIESRDFAIQRYVFSTIKRFSRRY